MSKGIQFLRDNYNELREKAYNNQMKKVTYKDIKKYREQAVQEIERMQSTAKF